MIVESKVVKVGIADMNYCKAPNKIRTSGLGSCVGVVLYDLNKQIAGLAHVMLPDSNLAKGKTIHKAKFADTAVATLIDILEKEGVWRRQLKAKIAGGAQMFTFNTKDDYMRIGPRNVEAVKKELQRYAIPLISEDVGGSSGRTIEFNPETGLLFVRTVNKGTKEI
ncbi:chemotaxis protein CheD [Pallidibacillus pasinlerensis]|uniref:Probable chemoreceptor glutamine deamidase CheD n=1 Tax=Pallidibacillus pasinlerensis TaxID=2703818 RepID=A0ABX0A5P6_9BACI|nr:chemotaxis protein CheD [Pallidibacillus pasinlerensis]NCU16508.1 chemotaxis protein CheD [Pallidibacillus pasinlerensis]